MHRLVDSGTSSSLARWCGIAAVVGGVLFAAWGYLHRDERDLFLTKADAPMFLRLVAVLVPLLFFIADWGSCMAWWTMPYYTVISWKGGGRAGYLGGYHPFSLAWS